MIIDFQSDDAPSAPEADICVIGAGAAGITLARAFIGTNTRVVVLESGGEEFEADTQDLYVGESVGLPYDLDTTRLRFLGGTTNHWEGVCGPLDAIDFEARDWIPLSGWPFSKETLDPYYDKAQPICKVGPNLYGDDAWEHIGREPLSFDRDKLGYGFRQMGEFPVRFGEEYRSEIAAADNIQLFLHANATKIQLHADAQRVEHVDIQTLSGKKGRVLAKYFVVACGGIENARILLVSDDVMSVGLGNQNDLVGRFFQEHPRFTVGELVTDDEDLVLESFLQEFVDGIRFVQHLKPSPAVQTRDRILNAMTYFEDVPKRDTGVAAARAIYSAFRKGESVDDLDEKIWQVLTDLDEVAFNAYRRFILGKGTRPPVERIELDIVLEQNPNPDSRITLLEERDALNLRRARLNWTLTDLERHTVLSLAKLTAAEVGRLGLGRVKMSEAWLDGDSRPEVSFGYHHMGTTRMSDDPKTGVVDRSGRIHGIDNVYVAGSSVFPIGGYMNPTLTIVALALRLSDHLQQRLA